MATFFSVYKYILDLINTHFGGLLYCGGWFVRMVCVFFLLSQMGDAKLAWALAWRVNVFFYL